MAKRKDADTMSISLPAPHPGVQAALNMALASRFTLIVAPRRWNKSTTALLWLMDMALGDENKAMLWLAPTFKAIKTVWREIKFALKDYPSANIRETDKEIHFHTGSFIVFDSADEPDNLRSMGYSRVVLDEAAFMTEETWTKVVRPMLIDTGGSAMFPTTPQGRNWVWRQMVRINTDPDDEWAYFHAPLVGCAIEKEQLVRVPHPHENPLIPFKEVESAYRTMPERAFRQEIMAEFLEDGAGVFRNISELTKGKPSLTRDPSHVYVAGVDWGRQTDATVFSVIDASTGEQVFLDRFRQVDYTLQMGRLRGLIQQWHPQQVLAEKNQMGAPLIEQAQREPWGRCIRGFDTYNKSKTEIIQELALAMERRDIMLLDNPIQRGELEAYEESHLPAGGLRYQAAKGMHDDCVMATALAWHAAQRIPKMDQWIRRSDPDGHPRSPTVDEVLIARGWLQPSHGRRRLSRMSNGRGRYEDE